MTVMVVDERVDSGPILAQERVPVAPDDTAESLGARLAEQGAGLLARTVTTGPRVASCPSRRTTPGPRTPDS